MPNTDFKNYLRTRRKRFDPTAIIMSILGIVGVVYSVTSFQFSTTLLDIRSLIIVVGGTIAIVLFQFDFSSTFSCTLLVSKSLFGTPEKKLLSIMSQLDDAILDKTHLQDLREGAELNGEFLNDVVFMHHQGLLFEEINELMSSRIADIFLIRRTSVEILRRAAIVAPALGLFGTVMGLIGVLKTLSDPTQIGPSMSLALMTTAYGAGLGSLVFTPLSGRLEHHNTIFLEFHQQLLSKIAILLHREERDFTSTHQPEDIQA